jgi:hypothetical protein
MTLPQGSPLFTNPLSHEHLLTLGLICAAWSYVEFVVELNFMFFGKKKIPDIPRDMKEKSIKLQNFVEVRVSNKNERKRIISLLTRVRIVAGRRNLAIHGKWATDVSTQQPVAVSWFAIGPNDPLKQLSADSLPALHDEIVDLSRSIHDVWLKYKNSDI